MIVFRCVYLELMIAPVNCVSGMLYASIFTSEFGVDWQVKLPFEKLVHALRNFPEDALQPDVLLPLAYNIKVGLSPCLSVCSFVAYVSLPKDSVYTRVSLEITR